LNLEKDIKLTYTNTSGHKINQISDNFEKDKKSGLYKLVFSILAPISEFSISTLDGEVNIKCLQGFVFNESTTSKSSHNSIYKQIDKLYLIQEESYELLSNLKDEFHDLSKFKNSLDELETDHQEHLSSLKVEIDEKDNLLSDVNEKLKSVNVELTEKKDLLAETTATLKLTRDKNGSLEQSNKVYSENLEILKKDVRDQTNKLKTLQDDVDIFSEDFKSFTGETRKQQLFYGAISILFLGVLFFITISLFEKAGDLITFFDQGKIESVWDVFLSRIPFMFAVLGIVAFIAEGIKKSY
jgi:hypothetical protein